VNRTPARRHPRLAAAAAAASGAIAAAALVACSGETTVSQPTTSSGATSSGASSTSASSTGASSTSASSTGASSTSASSTSGTGASSTSPSTASTSPSGTTSAGSSTAAAQRSGTTVRLAFGGDTNTANSAARVLSDGMGSAARVLAAADLSMVNIETVLADDRSGLTREPKAFNFVAPTRLLDVVGKAGVDVVTVANNHGLDYGPLGLKRTLAARSSTRPHLIGAGNDLREAFAPYRTTVRGRGVLFLAATDVLDAGLQWAATATRAGLASIKTAAGYAAMRSAVRADRVVHPGDVIVVYLHAGVELNVCPTSRQKQVASDLASDGASAVLMSHAHVVQPGAVLNETAVAYGLGNFVFAAQSGATASTGVMEIDVPPTGAPTEVWHPGRISGGIPTIFTGSEAARATARWKALGSHC